MAHEMIEEDKLFKMSHSALHDNPLATTRGNSEKSSENLMAPTCSSESQLQRDIKRQKTYELEASEQQKNVQLIATVYPEVYPSDMPPLLAHLEPSHEYIRPH